MAELNGPAELHLQKGTEPSGAVLITVSGELDVSNSQMLEAAIDGLGVAYVLEHEAAVHIGTGRLVRVLEDWCPYYSGFYLYYPGRRQVPAALRAFIDFVSAGRAASGSR